MDDDRRFSCCHNNLINDCGTRDYYPILSAAVRKGTFGHTGVVGFHNPPIQDEILSVWPQRRRRSGTLRRVAGPRAPYRQTAYSNA